VERPYLEEVRPLFFKDRSHQEKMLPRLVLPQNPEKPLKFRPCFTKFIDIDRVKVTYPYLMGDKGATRVGVLADEFSIHVHFWIEKDIFCNG